MSTHLQTNWNQRHFIQDHYHFNFNLLITMPKSQKQNHSSLELSAYLRPLQPIHNTRTLLNHRRRHQKSSPKYTNERSGRTQTWGITSMKLCGHSFIVDDNPEPKGFVTHNHHLSSVVPHGSGWQAIWARSKQLHIQKPKEMPKICSLATPPK